MLPVSCEGTHGGHSRGLGWEAGVQRVPVCPQLSHDANETLPLHLYVKSYGKNIDSRLQGGWGGQLGWWAGKGSKVALLTASFSLRSDPLQLLLRPQRLQPVPGR